MRETKVALSGITNTFGEEQVIAVADISNSDLNGVHWDAVWNSFLYTDSINNPIDSIFSDFDAFISAFFPVFNLNSTLCIDVIITSPVNLGFTSNMYHDEQIRQGNTPSYFSKNLDSSAIEPHPILMPIIYSERTDPQFPCDLSINEINNELEVYLFPNPTSTTALLSSLVGIEKVVIYSTCGKLVQEMSYNGGTEVLLNVDSIESGCYLLEVTGENDQKDVIRFFKD